VDKEPSRGRRWTDRPLRRGSDATSGPATHGGWMVLMIWKFAGPARVTAQSNGSYMSSSGGATSAPGPIATSAAPAGQVRQLSSPFEQPHGTDRAHGEVSVRDSHRRQHRAEFEVLPGTVSCPNSAVIRHDRVRSRCALREPGQCVTYRHAAGTAGARKTMPRRYSRRRLPDAVSAGKADSSPSRSQRDPLPGSHWP